MTGNRSVDAFEAHLRDALASSAAQITPADRLAAIQAATASPTPDRQQQQRGIPPWLLPIAASFLVLAVGLGSALLLRPAPADPGFAPAASPAGPVVISEAMPAPSELASKPAGGVTAQVAKRFEWSAPVYYVAPGTSVHPWLLYRDFVRTTMGDDSLAARVITSVNLALGDPGSWGPAMPGQDRYLRAWPAGSRAEASVDDNRITIALSAPGVDGLTHEQQKAAVQAPVWTATGAAQRNVPVELVVLGGGPLFSSVPAGIYRRPADATAELAPVWVTSPGRFASVWDGRVLVEGQACTFEGIVQWELRSGPTVISSGHTQATSMCPARGTWRVELGPLPPGPYVITAFESGAESGGVVAEHSVAFTVR